MARRKSRENRPRRKDAQLCAQVRDALEWSLEASGDDTLSGVWVRDVMPAPDAAHLLAVVEVTDPRSIGTVRERLVDAKGYLRAEVAASITRKRAPELRFEVVPPFSLPRAS